MQRMYDASADSQNVFTRVSQLEKSKLELQEELRACQEELSRAYTAVITLESLQKSQEKALDNWGSSYREASSELETLRAENANLRNELRQMRKDMDSLLSKCRCFTPFQMSLV